MRPKAGGVIDMDYNFPTKDVVMPHPVYGWMSWVCILNPSKDTFQKIMPLFDESYDLVLMKYARTKL